MMRKEDMSMGQLFEFCRMFPEDLDGFIFEQKVNETISSEFTRIQARVENNTQNMTGFMVKMQEFEKKVDIVRA